MKKRILIIDDEKSVGTILKFNLNQSGYTVLSTYNPTEGIEMANNMEIDLFILDVAIPGMNGIDICAYLRGIPRYAETPILMISSKSDIETHGAAQRAGANEYILKPFPFELLSDKIKQYLS